MKWFIGPALACAVLVNCEPTSAITVDGTADATYGAPLAVQNTQTGFGDSNLGQVDVANGSELDEAFGVITSSTLYLLLAGNLESNFNSLNLFFDTGAGGQNRLVGNNPTIAFNALNRMGDDGSGNGLTFDVGFNATYYALFQGGGTPYKFYANYAQLQPGGTNGYFVGSTGAGGNGVLSGGTNPFGLLATVNNSNTNGVTGGTGADSGLGVTAGIELAIPLAALGNPTGPIKVCAFISNSDGSYLSNQTLGGIGGGPNFGSLMDVRSVNFNTVPGNQYFTVVPEPSTVAFVFIGLVSALVFRRR